MAWIREGRKVPAFYRLPIYSRISLYLLNAPPKPTEKRAK